jgi:hypothetical protein
MMRIAQLVASLVVGGTIAYPDAGVAQQVFVGEESAGGHLGALSYPSGAMPSPVQTSTWTRKGKFWLHANFGVGYGEMRADDPSLGDMKISGVAGVGGVALGAFVSDNVVLFGDIIANVLSGPTLKVGTVEFATTDNFTATAAGIGAGIGYVGPDALMIQASVAVSYLTFEARTPDGNIEAETNPGFGARIALGKDWLVSRKVALGVAGHGYWGVMKDKGENAPTWNAFGVGVTFSFAWVPKGYRSEGV